MVSDSFWLATSTVLSGLPRWLSGKESVCQLGDADLIPGSERSPGGWNGNPFECFCLESPMDREAWWATVHGVARSWTWLSNWACTRRSFNACVCYSNLTLCDPMDYIACQAPRSMEFSRQGYGSGLPFPPPGDLLDPGIELGSSALQVDALPTELLGKPFFQCPRHFT